jgi:electron transfer flavoprotein alpha subunit
VNFLCLYYKRCLGDMASIARKTALMQVRAQTKVSHLFSISHLRFNARLLSSLAILEQRDGKLNQSSISAIVAAQKLGGSVTAFVAGRDAKAVAERAAKIKGVEKVIYVANDAYERVRFPELVSWFTIPAQTLLLRS